MAYWTILFVVSLTENVADGNSGIKYKVMDIPISLPFQKPTVDKPNPKQGIG